jgi:hypothetical protein
MNWGIVKRANLELIVPLGCKAEMTSDEVMCGSKCCGSCCCFWTLDFVRAVFLFDPPFPPPIPAAVSMNLIHLVPAVPVPTPHRGTVPRAVDGPQLRRSLRDAHIAPRSPRPPGDAQARISLASIAHLQPLRARGGARPDRAPDRASSLVPWHWSRPSRAKPGREASSACIPPPPERCCAARSARIGSTAVHAWAGPGKQPRSAPPPLTAGPRCPPIAAATPPAPGSLRNHGCT